MNVRDETALRLLQQVGKLPCVSGKNDEFTLWYYSHGLDETTASMIDWVKALRDAYQRMERAARVAVQTYLSGKGDEHTFDDVLRGFLIIIEANKAIKLEKSVSKVWHARLYDTRLKYEAVSTAFYVATNKGATVTPDILLLIKAWVIGLDKIGEKWTKELRAELVALMKDWCVVKSVPQAFKGLRGVSYDEKRGQWQAQVTIAGKQKRLGRYTSEGEACLAVLKHRASAADQTEATRKPRKSDGQRKYVGIVPHPDADETWAICVPHANDDDVEAFLDATKQSDDPQEIGEKVLFGCYNTRYAAARGYDLFARRYLPNPRLNFPLRGEMNAKGERQLLEGRRAEDEAAFLLFNEFSYVEAEKRGKMQDYEKRGVLPLDDGSEVFIGVDAAWILSRFTWRALPTDVADVFSRADDLDALLAQGKHKRGEPVSDDLYPLIVYFGSNRGLARRAFDQWKRNNGSAVWTEYCDKQTGRGYLSLEDAVYAVHLLELPRKDTIGHTGSDKRNYGFKNLELVG